MKKCWAPDPVLRPRSAELDTILNDMRMQDAEPVNPDQQNYRTTADMLNQIFPKHVAEALKAGQKVEAEQHDEVTVIFSDIVKFTDISRTSTPLKVSQMLDRLYLAFDRVAQKHGVFKVEVRQTKMRHCFYSAFFSNLTLLLARLYRPLGMRTWV